MFFYVLKRCELDSSSRSREKGLEIHDDHWRLDIQKLFPFLINDSKDRLEIFSVSESK